MLLRMRPDMSEENTVAEKNLCKTFDDLPVTASRWARFEHFRHGFRHA